MGRDLLYKFNPRPPPHDPWDDDYSDCLEDFNLSYLSGLSRRNDLLPYDKTFTYHGIVQQIDILSKRFVSMNQRQENEDDDDDDEETDEKESKKDEKNKRDDKNNDDFDQTVIKGLESADSRDVVEALFIYTALIREMNDKDTIRIMYM